MATVNTSWAAPAANGGSAITSYRVERRVGAGPFAFLAGPTTTTYADASAADNTQYGYRVAAVNANGTGLFTAEATITTPAGVGGVYSQGFDTDAGSWTSKLQASAPARATDRVRSGSGALKWTATAAGAGTEVQGPLFAVTAGAARGATAYISGADPTSQLAYLAVLFYNGTTYLSGDYYGPVQYVTVGTGWTLLTGSFTSPATATQARLLVGVNPSAAVAWWIDDVVVN